MDRCQRRIVSDPKTQQVNPWQELIFTVLLPSLALEYLSADNRLGPFGALCASMVPPILFGLYSWHKKFTWNLFSIIGLGTVILSGILGLFEMSAFWIGIKESSISIVIALAFPVTAWFGKPLLDAIFMQPQFINVRAIQKARLEPHKDRAFKQMMLRCSWTTFIGMTLCSVGNFFYALYVLGDAVPGSEEFVKGLSKLNWMSMIVIGIPMTVIMMMVFFQFLKGAQTITQLEKDDLLNPGQTVRRKINGPQS